MLTSDSHVIRKEACPACRKLGHDKSGDNLAVYSDGHTYCFRCGNGTGRKSITTSTKQNSTTIVLPSDVTTELPIEARDWLRQYQLARLDLLKNHVMWSDKWSRIVFPYFNENELLAWQGRYIPCGKNQVEINGKAPAKWFSQGKIHEIIHPINIKHRHATLVEDIISAIKISHVCGAIPIFGSSVSTKQILRLKTILDTLTIWLDPDMRSKSIKLAQTCNILGIKTNVIFSDKDPKDHTYEKIYEIIHSTQSQLC